MVIYNPLSNTMKESIRRKFNNYLHFHMYEGTPSSQFEQYLVDVIFKLTSNQLSVLMIKNMYAMKLNIIKLFVENGADPRYKNDKPFLKACKDSTVDVIQYFLDCGADINVHGGLGLVNVVDDEYNDLDEDVMIKVHFLIDAGIKISPRLIQKSCSGLSPDMVKLLLEHGVNPNTLLKYLFRVSTMAKGSYYERTKPNDKNFALCVKLVNEHDPNYGLVTNEIVTSPHYEHGYYYNNNEFDSDLFDNTKTDDEEEDDKRRRSDPVSDSESNSDSRSISSRSGSEDDNVE